MRRPRIKTLRGRLTIWHLGILALSLTAYAFLSYQALSRHLYRHHDEELASQAEELIQALATGFLDEQSVSRAVAAAQIGSRLVMIRDQHGQLLYGEPVLESQEPDAGRHQALVHAAAAGVREPQFFTVTLERSGETRFICEPLRQPNAYLQIGDPLGDVRTTLRSTAISWLMLIPAVLGLSSFGGWLVARRALRPMRAVGATLRDVHASDLSSRVDAARADQELQELAGTINHLLDRLQRAFDSSRQFAGDVSHQIQTPLTVMKSTLESARRRAGQTAEQSTLVDSLAEEVDALSAILISLREFALADAPIMPAGPIDLSRLVDDASDVVGALGELRGVKVETNIEPGVLVRGDPTRLKQVVLNLGDNAVKYAGADGQVLIELRSTATDALVSLRDNGIGIAPKDLPRLFDRLYRTDAADRASAGTGLGLAIVKRILDAHGGTISVESRQNGGSVFTVRLPRAGGSE